MQSIYIANTAFSVASHSYHESRLAKMSGISPIITFKAGLCDADVSINRIIFSNSNS